MKEIFELKDARETCCTPKDLFTQAQRINIKHDQEHCIACYLDSRNHVIDAEVLFIGGPNSTLIDPRTLFRRALLHNAVGVALAHNHPSGNLSPSDSDRRAFERLTRQGDLLEIEVIDFLIFNEKEFYSCRGDL